MHIATQDQHTVFFLWTLQSGKVTAHIESPSTSPNHINMLYFKSKEEKIIFLVKSPLSIHIGKGLCKMGVGGLPSSGQNPETLKFCLMNNVQKCL